MLQPIGVGPIPVTFIDSLIDRAKGTILEDINEIYIISNTGFYIDLGESVKKGKKPIPVTYTPSEIES